MKQIKLLIIPVLVVLSLALAPVGVYAYIAPPSGGASSQTSNTSSSTSSTAVTGASAAAASTADTSSPQAAACTGSGGSWDGSKCTQATDGSTGKSLFGKGGTFSNVTNLLIFIVGAISVLMVIVGGLRYVLSGGDAAGTKGAKDTILYAIIGVVVAIVAYALVNFVIGRLT